MFAELQNPCITNLTVSYRSYK